MFKNCANGEGAVITVGEELEETLDIYLYMFYFSLEDEKFAQIHTQSKYFVLYNCLYYKLRDLDNVG
ncbi:Hypothetical protein CINCED_3A025018 [Cinara cedri]|uniref:Uncharacterized protein n=1 Tax=Cinara cedri TaxID=506608 RepID=A0A5E4M828_9HEMI|nr:Hypothetical protein CINCED_3A025018 [Cinara cedri]